MSRGAGGERAQRANLPAPTAALKYLVAHTLPVDSGAFDRACGVGEEPDLLVLSSRSLIALSGFSATPEEITASVRAYVLMNKDELAKTSWKGASKAFAQMRTTDELRWANAVECKAAMDATYLEVFGPKEAAVKAVKVSSIAGDLWRRRADDVDACRRRSLRRLPLLRPLLLPLPTLPTSCSGQGGSQGFTSLERTLSRFVHGWRSISRRRAARCSLDSLRSPTDSFMCVFRSSRTFCS